MSTAPSINKDTSPSQDHVLDPATTVPDDAEMKDVTPSETRLADSKSSEGSAITNQEPEVELFLRGITDQIKWQQLVSKWLAFEKDYPIKGVCINIIFIIVVTFRANVIISRT